jgi:hypothetical protein
VGKLSSHTRGAQNRTAWKIKDNHFWIANVIVSFCASNQWKGLGRQMSERKPTYIRLDQRKKEQLDIALMLMGIPSYQQFFEEYVDRTITEHRERIELMEQVKNGTV